jgi:hypothetical protein
MTRDDAPTLRTLALRVLAKDGTARGTIARQKPEKVVPSVCKAGTGKTELNQTTQSHCPTP